MTAAGQLWNGTAFVAVAPSAWPACTVPLVEQTGVVNGIAVGTGLYYGNFPAAIPAGSYNVVYRQQAGSSPVSTDAGIGAPDVPIAWAGAVATPTPTPTPTVQLNPTLRANGVPFDADVGPDGTQATAVRFAGAVTRTDASGVLQPAVNPATSGPYYLSHVGTGQYAYNLSGGVAGGTYQYQLAFNQSGTAIVAPVQTVTFGGAAPTYASGSIVTQASLLTFLSQSSLGELAKGNGPSGTIDVPTLQQAIQYAEAKVFGVLGQLRARSGSGPVTTFIKFPLTVGGVPLLQATNSIALYILQAAAHRYTVRKLNEARSFQSVSDLTNSDDPAEASRGFAAVASVMDKAATAELKRIIRWATGYSEDATYVDLDLSPGAIVGAPYQGIQAPAFAGPTREPSGRRIERDWEFREGVGLGWGWWD